METSRIGLARHIRRRRGDILREWERVAWRLPANRDLAAPVLRDEVPQVLQTLVDQIEGPHEVSPRDYLSVSSLAVREHVLQRVAAGVTVATLAAEILALRDVIEDSWPAAGDPDARDALSALRRAVEAVVLASIERFGDVRMRLLDAVDTIVRSYPGGSVDGTLHNVLEALFKHVEGVDVAAVLIRERDVLRVRAALGWEAGIAERMTVNIGEGFAGLIAEERTPRLVRSAATDPLVLPAAVGATDVQGLYGVPLLWGNELLGVAHIGSRHAHDFSAETKSLFRLIMDRIAGILYQEVLAERLALEQARSRAIFENAPTVIFLKDLDGRYLAINRRGLAELGMEPSEFIGKTDEEVFPPAIAESLRSTDRQVLETGATVEREETVLRHGREPRVYLSIKFPIRDSSGRAVSIGGVSTDITERRRSQEAQTFLLEIDNLLSSSLDYDLWLPELARRTLPLLADCCIIDLLEGGAIRRVAVEHREPAKAELSRRLEAFPLDRTRPHLVQAVLSSREPVLMQRISRRYLDTISQGDEHRSLLRELDPQSMIQVPLIARGTLLGALVLVRDGRSPPHDQTDLQLANDLGWRTSVSMDNSRLYKLAQTAARAREEMAAVVAHDLRNPLGTILLSAQRLASELPPGTGEARRGVEVIVHAAERMTRLVSDLLEQHAIEAGQILLTPRVCSVAQLLHDAAETQRLRMAAASLSLDVQIPEDPLFVHADPARVVQVFGNLIDNAVRFTPGGRRISIGAARHDDEVRFFVRDSGPGFPPEALGRVFDRYWRGRSRDRQGMGLGLAICKGIVEAHGGRVWASNEEGGGGVVHFTLPRASSERASMQEPRALH